MQNNIEKNWNIFMNFFNFSKEKINLSSSFFLLCDAPDLWQFRLQDHALTSFYFIHFGIFLIVVFLLVLLLEEKLFKNFSKNNKLLLLLVLGFIALCFSCYILNIYLFVGTILLYIDVAKFKFTKQELKLENHKIDYEILPNMFEIKYYHVIFIILTLIIVFFFNVFVGVVYSIFIILGFVGALFKLNIYNVIPKKLYLYSKNFKKDLNTIKYHWSTNFFFFKILNRLTLISLPLGIFFLALMLSFHSKNDPILLLNLCEISIVFFITFIGFFLLDVYIILFGNSSVFNKFGMFCYRCSVYSVLGLSAGNITEKQFLHNSFDKLGFQWQPTFFTNIPRIMTNQPTVADYDQYWYDHLICKYLPDVTQEQYVHKRNNIVSQIDSIKANQLLKSNWQTISENASKQELGRVCLDQGYISSTVTRK